jgi:hypothetical protein
MKKTIYRTCPKCLPNSTADFDYYETRGGFAFYRCRNCFYERRLTPRPASTGSNRQQTTLERIRKIAGVREVKVTEDKSGGCVSVLIHGEQWWDSAVYVVIGPRGGIKDCQVWPPQSSAKKKTVRGRHKVWSAIEVYGGDKAFRERERG